MIYAIAEDDDGPVKIGTSATVDGIKNRLIKFQMGNHRVLCVIALMDGDRSTEKALHGAFAEQRVRGEWFRREGPVVGLLEQHAIQPLRVRDLWPDPTITDALMFRQDIERALEQKRRQAIEVKERKEREQALKRAHRCSHCRQVGHYETTCLMVARAQAQRHAMEQKGDAGVVLPFAWSRPRTGSRTWVWRGRVRPL